MDQKIATATLSTLSPSTPAHSACETCSFFTLAITSPSTASPTRSLTAILARSTSASPASSTPTRASPATKAVPAPLSLPRRRREDLADLAQRKRLLPAWVLEREAKRLMPKDATDVFVRDFTGQWLDIALLTEIMPDPKFGFTPDYVHMARSETEHFFAEMLRENRPMTDFIDPDFTYTSPLFAKDVYQLDLGSGKKKKDVLRRIELKRGGRVGGLLGQSAIMMATANGVDTQPVLRGVWVLENILGTPPPEPPNDIPALTPDTRGTTTPREMLAAHTKEATCAVCHKQIDPIGFALENFDPVGRWRTKWPNANKAIDASVVLADGTKIRDVVDLKRWLVANIDQFSQCVAEKLMTYAAGRAPNYAERKELADIVRGSAILVTDRLSPTQRKAFGAITACRTAKLGGQRFSCDDC
ncbi:MAG TPA: DUF1588 domain-containing protein, partial [Acidobacteria bacterium]|nr:DUF1588 domain-containing protein [Acidobacteriota bacterium]